MAKSNYEEQADALGKAIDIAIAAIRKYPPKGFNDAHVNHFIHTYEEFKNDALFPGAKYRNSQSLSHVTTAALTFFQEGTGDAVNYFWREVSTQNLGFKRENKLQKVLKRGKIKNQAEYEFIIDVMVPYQQEGLIGELEAGKLKEMVGFFEKNIRDT
jgi:hypothetical protein